MKISIEGNIGCGKSSVLSKLCTEARIPVFLEPIDEWGQWLSEFYKDPSRWGMSFNLKVLMSFSKWKHNTFFACYERSPISNRYVFAQLQYDQKKMNALELQLFDDIYKQISWTPDVAIYIRTDPEVCLERMQKRARSCENGVPLEYLKAVHDRHEDIFQPHKNLEYLPSMYAKKSCKIIIIDGNKNKNEVYEDVITAIQGIQASIATIPHEPVESDCIL